MRSTLWRRLTLLTLLTAMVSLVTVSYWRLTSRSTVSTLSFRSEKATTATEARLSYDDVPTLSRLNDEYMKVARLVESVLVSIDTTGVKQLSEPTEDGKNVVEKKVAVHGLGSGVIVSREGHVITAYHVIQNKHALRVTLINGKSVPVHLVGVDPELDIAVLKIDVGMQFDPLPFGNSDDIQPGMIVLACGNPYGLGATVTRGLISARERKLTDTGVELLQTDAAIFPGNSGGPLINIRGEIVGINKSVLPTAEDGYKGIGFAIPSNLVLFSFRQICEHGRPMRGYLGLDLVANTPPLRSFLNYPKPTGAVVNVVKENSPAQKAGVLTGDVITAFNEIEIHQVQDLYHCLEGLSIGDQFRLTVWRAGESHTYSLEVGDSILQTTPAPWSDFLDDVGMHLRELSVEEQSIGAQGLLVIQVDAKKSVGTILKSGDMVTAINHQLVSKVEDFVAALKEGPVVLTIYRDGQQFNVKVDARSSGGKQKPPMPVPANE